MDCYLSRNHCPYLFAIHQWSSIPCYALPAPTFNPNCCMQARNGQEDAVQSAVSAPAAGCAKTTTLWCWGWCEQAGPALRHGKCGSLLLPETAGVAAPGYLRPNLHWSAVASPAAPAAIKKVVLLPCMYCNAHLITLWTSLGPPRCTALGLLTCVSSHVHVCTHKCITTLL